MKVSIITPAYNQANFLEETVRSVLNQDYPDIEYIVLDDGSTDNTAQIISPFLDRLTYVRHENIGESKTVNKGYGMCQGVVVGIVNSDDPLFTLDAVSRIVNCFKQNPEALAVYPDWVSIDETGRVIEDHKQPDFTIQNMLMEFNATLGPGMFIRRSALEKLGVRNETLKYTGDIDISFRLALAGKLAHEPQFLATHRIHSNAASTVAKGEIMAKEVLRLVELSLVSPLLPELLVRNYRKILANAYFSASRFCLKYSLLKWHYILRALFLGPDVILARFWNKCLRAIKTNL